MCPGLVLLHAKLSERLSAVKVSGSLEPRHYIMDTGSKVQLHTSSPKRPTKRKADKDDQRGDHEALAIRKKAMLIKVAANRAQAARQAAETAKMMGIPGRGAEDRARAARRRSDAQQGESNDKEGDHASKKPTVKGSIIQIMPWP